MVLIEAAGVEVPVLDVVVVLEVVVPVLAV
jgi:hypothetical protein